MFNHINAIYNNMQFTDVYRYTLLLIYQLLM